MLERRGLFVTVDGPNGVGKSTVVRGVASQLQELGSIVLETSEPTKSHLGQLVRQLEAEYHGRVYACLIAADRYHHLDQEVLPALREGKIVLSARYVASSLALQRLDNVDLPFIWALNSQIYTPDLSVILTAPVDVLQHRLDQRPSLSRFEQTALRSAELSYYFDAIAFLSMHGFNTLHLENGNVPIEENIARIVTAVDKLTRSRHYE
jgi:dTMP kinase